MVGDLLLCRPSGLPFAQVPIVNWPDGTPDDVRRLADALVAVLEGHGGQLVGSAIALVFACVVAELGDAPLEQVVSDVGQIAFRHGAFKPRPRH